MRNKLGLGTRDWIWLGTLIIGLTVSYAGMRTELTEIKRTVERVEARVWELGRARGALAGSVYDCPPDATRVYLTAYSEDTDGPDR